MSLLVKGAAFPASPSSGDPFFRDDLGFWCYYDGTRWLSQEFSIGDIQVALSATASRWYRLPVGSYGLFIPNRAIVCSSYVATTNDGSNYWTISITATNTTFGDDTVLHAFNTSGDSANTWTAHDDVPDSQTPSSANGIEVVITKSSSPGNINLSFGLAYRMIIT